MMKIQQKIQLKKTASIRDMINQDIKVLLFDIGGVLVELGGMQTMHEWTRFQYSTEEMMRDWLLSPVVRSYESGKSNARVFSKEIIEELKLPVSAEIFMEEFQQWPTRLFAGVKDLLIQLGQHYTLVSLSNTNDMHWPRISETLGLSPLFDHHFPSHLTGLLKPDREAFEQVCQALNVPPASILFFDDSKKNIEAAKVFGMHTALVHGVLEVKRFLHEAGLLKAA